uniref:Uncharacterized protein n=1 Tax=Ixodes ricinus TaxID=34613 RepID=A0A6B0V2K9_IXORI
MNFFFFFSSLVYCIIFPVHLEEARVHSQTFLSFRALLLGKFPLVNMVHVTRFLFPLRRSRRKRITTRPKYNLKPSLSTPQKGPRNKLPGSRRLGRCENSDTPNSMKSCDTTDRAECSGDPTSQIQRRTRCCNGWLNPLPVVLSSQCYGTQCGVFRFPPSSFSPPSRRCDEPNAGLTRSQIREIPCLHDCNAHFFSGKCELKFACALQSNP